MKARPMHVPHAADVRRRYLPLFGRIVLANLLVLLAACGTLIAIAPDRITDLATDEVLVATLFLVTLVNVLLVRRIVQPVQRLTSLARDLDPARPGARFPETATDSEVGELTLTFNDVLDRLEQERAESARSVLAAHEVERMRVAQELHDEVGQTLTAVLLLLSRTRGHLGPELAPELSEAQETVRESLEDVRRIASELRPETLADLGLSSALENLVDTFSRRTGIEIRREIAASLPPLAWETELALYRIAQEALTNVARHSGASVAELDLNRTDSVLALKVRDYGRGAPVGALIGNGIRGMRERTGAIGAHLTVGAPEHGPGTEVKLHLSLRGLE